jgi:hypothetical protein
MTDLIPGLSTTPAIGIRDLTQLRTTHAEITDIISILYLKAASHRLPNLTCRSDGEVRRAISWAEQHAGELAARSRSLERAMRPATEKEIGQSLLFLGGAFPNAGKIDLTAFGELFMQYVRDAAPSLIVLQAACDRVIRTSRFLPTISEALEAIAEARKELEGLRSSLSRLPQLLEEAKRAVERDEEDRREVAAQREFFRRNPEAQNLPFLERLAEFRKWRAVNAGVRT